MPDPQDAPDLGDEPTHRFDPSPRDGEERTSVIDPDVLRAARQAGPEQPPRPPAGRPWQPHAYGGPPQAHGADGRHGDHNSQGQNSHSQNSHSHSQNSHSRSQNSHGHNSHGPTGYAGYGQGTPGWGHGQPYPAPSAAPRGTRISGRTVAIVAGVVVVLVVAAVLGIRSLLGGGGAADPAAGPGADGGLLGGLASGAAPSEGCPSISTDDANAALGGSYDLLSLGGLGAGIGFVLDTRVLPDAPTCWGVEQGDGGRLVRIAVHTGADAADLFAAERTRANGSVEDKGNGLSVTTDGYYAGDIAAGDQAFCTSGDMTASAGALVRRGDTLVYVSTNAAGAGAGSVPEIDFTADKATFATDKANCGIAVAVAAKVR